MKKLFLFIILTLSIPVVHSESIDITNDAEINYKWYQNEIIDAVYYPKKDKLEGYLEDSSKVDYGEYSDWNQSNCESDGNYYSIEEKNIITYQKLSKIRYVLIQSVSSTCPVNENCLDEFDIYYDKQKVNYKILSDDYFGALIQLPMDCEAEKLTFYLNTEHLQVIFLSHRNVRYSYDAYSVPTKDKIVFFDDTWTIYNDPEYTTYEALNEAPRIPLIQNVKAEKICRIREIKTFRYKEAKRYYDDDYHTHIDNYLPDISDYKVNYTKSFPMETVEIIKEVPITKVEKEYIYLPKEEKEEDNIPKETTVYKTVYQDKIVSKTPKSIYLLIIILILITIIQTIRIIAKKASRKF